MWSILEPNFKFKQFVNLDASKLFNNNIIMLDNNGQKLTDSVTRYSVKDSKIPTHTINAFIYTEDRHFFKHNGMDNLRIVKSAIKNLLKGVYLEGASTITQQIAKNTHLNSNKKLHRKINELRLAKELERKYTKQELLNIYFDILYFGRNIYGLASAANAFFGKTVEELTLTESAYLVAIINNPSYFSPYNNFDNLEKRKNLVLTQLLKYNKISYQDATFAKNQILKFEPYDTSYYHINCIVNDAIENFNIANSIIPTAIDKKMTIFAKNTLERLTPTDCDSSIYAINNITNNVEFVYSTSNININNNKRQIGSTIKPLICYTPALEEYAITPMTPLNDAKTNFNGYSPSNYHNRYLGYITASTALAKSSNVIAIKILKQIGIDAAIIHARDFDLEFEANDNTLGIALGATSNGFSLPQIVKAYSSFPKLGILTNPCIFSNEFKKNNLPPFYDNQLRIMRSDTAHLINNMLRECVTNGTAKRLNSLPFTVCAKTGTVGFETHNTDAYCIAYTSTHTIGVWIGGDKMSNNITGGTIPTDIVKETFLQLYQNYNPPDLDKSQQVQTQYVNSDVFYNDHKLVKVDPNNPNIQKIKGEFSIFNSPSFDYSIYNKPKDTPSTQISVLKEKKYKDLLDNQININNYYYKYFDLLKRKNKSSQ